MKMVFFYHFFYQAFVYILEIKETLMIKKTKHQSH